MNKKMIVIMVAIALVLLGSGYALATVMSRTNSTLGNTPATFTRHHEVHANIAEPTNPNTKYHAPEIFCPSGAKAIGGGGVFEDDTGKQLPLVGSSPHPAFDDAWVLWVARADVVDYPLRGTLTIVCADLT